MREFIKQLFGFDKEIQSRERVVSYLETRVTELQIENIKLTDFLYRKIGLIQEEVLSPQESEFKSIKGKVPWRQLRYKLENLPDMSVKVKEVEDEIDNIVASRNNDNATN